MVRIEPFTPGHFLVQKYAFDRRLFISIEKHWLKFTQNHQTVLHELIPEFFFNPEFLYHSSCTFWKAPSADEDHIPQDIETNNAIALPPWAASPSNFIIIHRFALEHDIVSSDLHRWIDLIFSHSHSQYQGCKTFRASALPNCLQLSYSDDDKQQFVEEAQLGFFPNEFFNSPSLPRRSSTFCLSLVGSQFTNLIFSSRKLFLIQDKKIYYSKPGAKTIQQKFEFSQSWSMIQIDYFHFIVFFLPPNNYYLNNSDFGATNSSTFFTKINCFALGKNQIYLGCVDSSILLFSLDFSSSGPLPTLSLLKSLTFHSSSILSLTYSRMFDLLVSIDDNFQVFYFSSGKIILSFSLITLDSQVFVRRSFNFNCCIHDHGLIFISISKAIFCFSLTGKLQKTFQLGNEIHKLVECESSLIVVLIDDSLFQINFTQFKLAKLPNIYFRSIAGLPNQPTLLYLDTKKVLTKCELSPHQQIFQSRHFRSSSI